MIYVPELQHNAIWLYKNAFFMVIYILIKLDGCCFYASKNTFNKICVFFSHNIFKSYFELNIATDCSHLPRFNVIDIHIFLIVRTVCHCL